MTFIKKENKKVGSILLFLLATPVIFAIIAIVAVYNSTVDMKHGVVDMKENIQTVETQGAELKDKVFLMFDPQKVEELAKERGLVKETRPAYVQSAKWELASHF